MPKSFMEKIDAYESLSLHALKAMELIVRLSLFTHAQKIEKFVQHHGDTSWFVGMNRSMIKRYLDF